MNPRRVFNILSAGTINKWRMPRCTVSFHLEGNKCITLAHRFRATSNFITRTVYCRDFPEIHHKNMIYLVVRNLYAFSCSGMFVYWDWLFSRGCLTGRSDDRVAGVVGGFNWVTWVDSSFCRSVIDLGSRIANYLSRHTANKRASSSLLEDGCTYFAQFN